MSEQFSEPVDLGGRTVVVTGAGGIGGGVARALAARGARLAVIDYDEEALASLEAALPDGLAIAHSGDASDAQTVDTFIARVQSELGAPFGLVNNVGANPAGYRRFEEIDPELWDRVIALNLRSPFLFSRAVAPLMREAGEGRIVNITSIAGERAIPRLAGYSASKAGVISLTQVMATELAVDGIAVNAVSPGHTLTENARAIVPADIQERRATVIPAGRLGDPADIARAVLFLLADATWLTGVVINVDGGQTAIIPRPLPDEE